MANEGYKQICEKMGMVYNEMKTLVDAANVDGEMVPAMEEKYSQLKLQYANLEAQRTRNQELMGMDKTVTPAAPEVRVTERAFENNIMKQLANHEHRATEKYLSAFTSYIMRGEHTSPVEMRVLSEGTGGTVLAPITYDQSMAAKLQTLATVRNLSRKVDIGSFSREFVYENGTATAYWPGESTAPTEATPTYTNITLTPKRLSAIVRVSNELIEDSGVRGGPTVMSMVQEQFARVLAQTEEASLLPQTNVSGAPTSLFLTSSLPTSAASASAITTDQVIDFVYKLPRQYRSHPSCAIVTSDSTLAALRKLAAAGGTTNYFWQNGYQNVGAGAAGEPDRIMGIPVYVSAAVPAIATGNYIAMIGAWDYSIFASAQNFEFKVLRELYSPANETGFICNSRVDCKLLLPTLAFAAFKCA